MTGRHCKTCRHLMRSDARTEGRETFRCGYRIEIAAPWPYLKQIYAPYFIISPRHVIPGDHYPKDGDGSTSDWTEVMDCPVHEPQ